MSKNKNLMLCEGESEAYRNYKDFLQGNGYTVKYSSFTVATSYKIAREFDTGSILVAIIGDSFPDGDANDIAEEINDLRLGIPIIGLWLAHELKGADLNIHKAMMPSNFLLQYLSSY